MENIVWIIASISALISFVIATVLCVFVYKDAQKRGMKANAWVWVTALLGFIGLIIYLVSRKDRKAEKRCPVCGGSVKDSYAVCPTCGISLKETSPDSSTPTITSDLVDEPKKKGKAGLYVAIAFNLLMAVASTMLIGLSFSGFTQTTATVLSKETASAKCPEVIEWIDECNADEENDVFILYSEASVGVIVYTKGWIEADETPKFEVSTSEFNETQVKLLLPETKSGNPDAYSITFFDTMAYPDDFTAFSGNKAEGIMISETYADLDVFADWYADEGDVFDYDEDGSLLADSAAA